MNRPPWRVCGSHGRLWQSRSSVSVTVLCGSHDRMWKSRSSVAVKPQACLTATEFGSLWQSRARTPHVSVSDAPRNKRRRSRRRRSRRRRNRRRFNKRRCNRRRCNRRRRNRRRRYRPHLRLAPGSPWPVLIVRVGGQQVPISSLTKFHNVRNAAHTACVCKSRTLRAYSIMLSRLLSTLRRPFSRRVDHCPYTRWSQSPLRLVTRRLGKHPRAGLAAVSRLRYVWTFFLVA